MTCAQCGAPLDPTVTHVQHQPVCPHVLTGGDVDCGCEETCADCCEVPSCPLRELQETNMTDPMLAKIDGFLTDTEDSDVLGLNFLADPGTDPGYSSAEVVRMVRWLRDREAAPSVELVQALLESENVVDRLTAERDAAYAVIRLYDDGWKATHVTEEEMWFKDSLRVEHWESMSPAEVDAIRRARANPEETQP